MLFVFYSQVDFSWRNFNSTRRALFTGRFERAFHEDEQVISLQTMATPSAGASSISVTGRFLPEIDDIHGTDS